LFIRANMPVRRHIPHINQIHFFSKIKTFFLLFICLNNLFTINIQIDFIGFKPEAFHLSKILVHSRMPVSFHHPPVTCTAVHYSSVLLPIGIFFICLYHPCILSCIYPVSFLYAQFPYAFLYAPFLRNVSEISHNSSLITLLTLRNFPQRYYPACRKSR
jgi:hypothetical protein